MSWGRIPNPSTTETMIATLRRNDGYVEAHAIPPRESLAIAGRVIWPLWTLEWRRPRKGLMRFAR